MIEQIDTSHMDEQIEELKILPPTLSDHSFIQFILPSLHYLQPVHTIRALRGWKNFEYQEEEEEEPLLCCS